MYVDEKLQIIRAQEVGEDESFSNFRQNSTPANMEYYNFVVISKYSKRDGERMSSTACVERCDDDKKPNIFILFFIVHRKFIKVEIVSNLTSTLLIMVIERCFMEV